MMVTDLIINLYYYFHLHIDAFHYTQLVNYAVYALIIWLGTRFKPASSWLKLLGGGLPGAIFFYLITNTASWFQNPEYAKTLAGWFTALTKGTPGWPRTWESCANNLL